MTRIGNLKLLRVFLFSLLIIGSLFFISEVIAQETVKEVEYELLAPIPLSGASGPVTQKSTATNYIKGLFQLTIGLAGALAVVMLMYAGIKYMSTDAFESKSDAKGIIENALWGLLLVIGAWTILYTINPKLVEIGFNMKPLEIRGNLNKPGAPTSPSTPTTPPKPGSGATSPAPGTLSANEVEEMIAGTGVTLDISSGIIAGVKRITLEEVIALKKACGNCQVTITSTTGGVHESGACSHGSGNKVDLRNASNLSSYITKTFTEQSPRKNGDRVFNSPSGATYVWETNPPNPKPAQWSAHWDVAKCN